MAYFGPSEVRAPVATILGINELSAQNIQLPAFQFSLSPH
jgi:hypothetical protein